MAKAARGTVRATLIDASTPPTGTVRPVIAVCSYREAWRDDESGCNMASCLAGWAFRGVRTPRCSSVFREVVSADTKG